MNQLFEDRVDAGRRLGRALRAMKLENPVVFALPRGGVPVAAEVARALRAPLDLLLVRKIGAPGQPEVAVAAVAEGPQPIIEVRSDILRLAGASPEYIQGEVPRHLEEIERRRRLYLQGRTSPAVAGRTAVLVDDGIATGTTVRAALRSLRNRHPARIVLAVPVAPAAELADLRGEVDDLVCLLTPEPFVAVGAHYRHFDQTTDTQVIALMARQR